MELNEEILNRMFFEIKNKNNEDEVFDVVIETFEPLMKNGLALNGIGLRLFTKSLSQQDTKTQEMMYNLNERLYKYFNERGYYDE